MRRRRTSASAIKTTSLVVVVPPSAKTEVLVRGIVVWVIVVGIETCHFVKEGRKGSTCLFERVKVKGEFNMFSF